MSRLRPRRAATLLVVVGAVAAFLYCNFVIDWVLRGFEGMGAVVSHLAAPGEPYAMLLRVTDVVCAVLVLALLPSVRRALVPGWPRTVTIWSTAVFAIGAIGAAAAPSPCGPGEACAGSGQELAELLHELASGLSDLAFFVGVVAAWISTRWTGPRWFRMTAQWVFWVGGVAGGLLFSLGRLFLDTTWATGAFQRLHIVAMAAWIMALALLAADAARRRDAGPDPSPHDADDHSTTTPGRPA